MSYILLLICLAVLWVARQILLELRLIKTYLYSVSWNTTELLTLSAKKKEVKEPNDALRKNPR